MKGLISDKGFSPYEILLSVAVIFLSFSVLVAVGVKERKTFHQPAEKTIALCIAENLVQEAMMSENRLSEIKKGDKAGDYWIGEGDKAYRATFFINDISLEPLNGVGQEEPSPMLLTVEIGWDSSENKGRTASSGVVGR